MEVPKLLGQFRGSPQAQRPDLRGASDVHCGKSQAPRHELQLLAGGKERLSNRDRLCLDIDERLAKKPHSFEAFLFLMEQTGYTITRRKNITFSHSRQKRNIRMRSLSEEYQKDAICEVLLGKSIHNLRKRCSPLTEQKSQLVSSLEAKRNQGRGQYYDRAIQNQITKQQARALLYYQQHGFTSVEDLKLARTSVAEGAIFVHKGIGGAGLRWRPFSADRVGRRGCPNKQKQKVPPTGGIFLFGLS